MIDFDGLLSRPFVDSGLDPTRSRYASCRSHHTCKPILPLPIKIAQRSQFHSWSFKRVLQKVGKAFSVSYLGSGVADESRAWAVHQHRESFAESEPRWIPLEEAIDSAPGRNATASQDYFYGNLGLLHPELREKWFLTFGYSGITIEIFSQCSKLLYDISQSLLRIGEAKGIGRTITSDLSSWAVDLSADVPASYECKQRWELCKASPQSSFEGVDGREELSGLDLTLMAIPIGTVGACSNLLSEFELDLMNHPPGADVMLRHMYEWDLWWLNLQTRFLYFRNNQHLLFCDGVWRVTGKTASYSLVLVFSMAGCTEQLLVIEPNGRLWHCIEV